MKKQRLLRPEHGAEAVSIVDIIIIEVRAGVIAGYPRIIVVVLLRKQMSVYLQIFKNYREKSRKSFCDLFWFQKNQGNGLESPFFARFLRPWRAGTPAGIEKQS